MSLKPEVFHLLPGLGYSVGHEVMVCANVMSIALGNSIGF